MSDTQPSFVYPPGYDPEQTQRPARQVILQPLADLDTPPDPTVERIPLRAVLATWPTANGPRSRTGVALPDGRIIVGDEGGIKSFSSVAVIQTKYPGAVVVLVPDADPIVNGGPA